MIKKGDIILRTWVTGETSLGVGYIFRTTIHFYSLETSYFRGGVLKNNLYKCAKKEDIGVRTETVYSPDKVATTKEITRHYFFNTIVPFNYREKAWKKNLK